MDSIPDDTADQAFDSTVALIKEVIYAIGERRTPPVALRAMLCALYEITHEQRLEASMAECLRAVTEDLVRPAAPAQDNPLLDQAMAAIRTGVAADPAVEAVVDAVTVTVRGMQDRYGANAVINGLATAFIVFARAADADADCAHKLRVLAELLEHQAAAAKGMH